MHLSPAFIGPENFIWIALVALLIFGRRLPEVGRSLGKGIIEFKKGIAGIEDDINTQVQQPTQQRIERPVLTSTQLPAQNQNYKFDPYTGQPIAPAQPQMRFDPYTGKPLTEAASSQTTSNT